MERFDNEYKSWGKAFDAVNVSGERTVYSDPIPVGATGTIGIWYKAVSAGGVPKVRLFYEVSYDDDTDNFATPDGASNINDLFSGEVPYVTSIIIPPMPYVRFGAEGKSGNPDDTILTEVIFNV